jgi:hypothetical protein
MKDDRFAWPYVFFLISTRRYDESLLFINDYQTNHPFLCSTRAKSLTLQQIFKVFVVIKDENAKLPYIF